MRYKSSQCHIMLFTQTILLCILVRIPFRAFHCWHPILATLQEFPLCKWCITVSAIDLFSRPINTIISVILNTIQSGCMLYLVYYFYFVLLNIQSNYATYYLIYCTFFSIIYLPKVLLLLLFGIFASWAFTKKSERRCNWRGPEYRTKRRREERKKEEKQKIAIVGNKKRKC